MGGTKRGRESTAVVASSASKKRHGGSEALVEVPRTSSLVAPIVKLSGHAEAVNGVEFSKSGQLLASCSLDKKVLLWKVFTDGPGSNYGMLEGHSNSVSQVCWSSDDVCLLSSSADKSVTWWDATSGEAIQSFLEHKGFVNCCSVSASDVLASGSDDCSVRIWDHRQGKKSTSVMTHDFPVASVCFSHESAGAPLLLSGGVDGVVQGWDLRKGCVFFKAENQKMCNGVITGLACGPKGKLLTNASDGSVCEWDARAFVKGGDNKRFVRKLSLNNEDPPINRNLLLLRAAVSPTGTWYSAGSSRTNVPIWRVQDGSLEYNLPGHQAPVTCVDFHPTQSIIVSSSLDKSIYLGEIEAASDI